MTISADESVWARSGDWIGHNSMRAEHRYIDFSLKVVPRTLQYPNPIGFKGARLPAIVPNGVWKGLRLRRFQRPVRGKPG